MSIIYRVSYFGILTFQKDAWDKLGYMGPLAMGPFLFILAVVSTLRGLILKLMKMKSSNQILHAISNPGGSNRVKIIVGPHNSDDSKRH